METRERTADGLKVLGFTVLPSKANFVFASHPQRSAAALFAALRQKKILVRYFDKPGIDQFLRITIGTDDEMEALLGALQEILQN